MKTETFLLLSGADTQRLSPPSTELHWPKQKNLTVSTNPNENLLYKLFYSRRLDKRKMFWLISSLKWRMENVSFKGPSQKLGRILSLVSHIIPKGKKNDEIINCSSRFGLLFLFCEWNLSRHHVSGLLFRPREFKSLLDGGDSEGRVRKRVWWLRVALEVNK